MTIPWPFDALYRAWCLAFITCFTSPFRSARRPPPATTQNADVVIVGAGLAGLCAALSASEAGASVLLLDRAHGGGTTSISGGVVYAGGGTAQQRAAGYDDTPDAMFRYLSREVGGAVDEGTLRRFCDGSVANMTWLERHGVEFSGELCPFRTSYPTSRYFLFWSGNEKASPFAEEATPAPRGHRAVGKGTGGMGMTGGVLWEALFRSAVRMGVRFEAASRVEEVLVDEDGRVTGVKYRALDERSRAFGRHRDLTRRAAEYHGMSVRFFADRLDRQADSLWRREATAREVRAGAVILAAGGFVMDKAMTREHISWADTVAPLGTAGDDGSGIRLGQSVGGAVSFMDRMSAWRLLYPPEALVEGIVVSADGQRIGAEDLYGASLTEIMVRDHGGKGFLILDSEQWKKAKGQVSEQTQMPWTLFILYLLYWAYKKAGSLEGLAGRLHMQKPGLLREAVEEYNDAITSGRADPVGKRGYRSVIMKPPFYGIDISLRPTGLLMAPALPLGGLRVDESGMVLKESGEGIQGLYAAGKNAAGISSNRYISGLALADCVFSGRNAGSRAAEGVLEGRA